MAGTRYAGAMVGLLAAMLLAAPAGAGERVRSGTVTVEGWRLSFIGSIGGADGVLHYQGKSYRFDVAGLGIGGFGFSSTKATGTVYDLKSVDDFVGTYGVIRSGITVGDEEALGSGAPLWVQNDKGVSLELRTQKVGLQLNLGADGMIVTWDR